MQTMLTLKPERLILFKLPFLPPAADEGNEDLCIHSFTARRQNRNQPISQQVRSDESGSERAVGRGCWCRFTVEVKVMGVNGLSGVPLPLAGFLSTPAVRCFQELCFRRHGENAHLSVPDLRLESPERRTNTMSIIW